MKINQFPGLFVIGRKDKLWTSYQNMMNTFGTQHFGFLPRTFIVPEDKEELVRAMKESKKAMIVKPPNWYCGIGIKLINKIGRQKDIFVKNINDLVLPVFRKHSFQEEQDVCPGKSIQDLKTILTI